MSVVSTPCASCGVTGHRIICDGECGRDITDHNPFMVELVAHGGHPRRHAYYCGMCAVKNLPDALTRPIGLLANGSPA
jgi:hypothetical protein